jgi:hypothetical protein
MQFLEKDLENIIFKAPNEKLREKGLAIFGEKRRQVRIGNYGIADLITFERAVFYPSENKEKGYHYDPPRITIYELKQNKVNASTFLQAIGYTKGIKRYLRARGIQKCLFRICLIGKEIDTSGNFPYLADVFSGVDLISYDYDFDGISFETHSDFKLKNEGFLITSKAAINLDEPF